MERAPPAAPWRNSSRNCTRWGGVPARRRPAEPLSRKRGLSKTALGQALQSAGIVYEHRRELGNPKDNRPGFADTGAAHNQARAHYAALLHRPEARQAIEDVAAAGRTERVAVLCFESDEAHCHRRFVLEEIQLRLGRGTPARGGQ
ncbi:DUF488 family protein, N3 subclade [Micromonosporaceae bacterium Da 78-11]